mmetsp:Transcript_7790/g.20058  ORF Transcript_7790/g.20058 Transcript_7790/m.20058 type:complete len:345 (-) Transcript_7790:176-1210(-)|eukprot:CAMPEP_0119506216 /NCGR_PEP_ID=MMETSP1344-20130328/26513_1 /TAXON_ID=236787 /ORGANISM="Florenciella parvula, Strain CCMP2471" /LENGTH=344 /DNA_ID=CAMNT_0007542737 /DNA_START=340 /DNA_END=1374 /DNA_ORIENTATION=-
MGNTLTQCADSSQSVKKITEVSTGSYPVPLYKDSKLFAPTNHQPGPVPALVITHGQCAELDFVGDMLFGLAGLKNVRTDWQMMQHVAREIAAQGVIVLMIGMPDDDGAVLKRDFPNMSEAQLARIGTLGVLNEWPAIYFAKAFNAAIDHVCSISPKELGLEVDKQRIGICGHSMGGVGALLAASTVCRDRIKAVISLNTGYASVFEPYDAVGAISGIDGKDISQPLFDHLKTIEANLFISQTEPEINAMVGEHAQATAPDLYPAIGTAVEGGYKEMYVDKETFKDEPFLKAHTWLASNDAADVTGYNGGVTVAAINSFVRRMLVGIDEPRMTKPENVADWVYSV